MTVSVVPSPARVNIIIKIRDGVIVSPTLIIIMRAIPTTSPWTPPPTIPEKNVYVYFGNCVYAVRIRYHYHLRRRRENDRRRKRKSDTYIYLCPGWYRNNN
jgi:hypothetical protein